MDTRFFEIECFVYKIVVEYLIKNKPVNYYASINGE